MRFLAAVLIALIMVIAYAAPAHAQQKEADLDKAIDQLREKAVNLVSQMVPDAVKSEDSAGVKAPVTAAQKKEVEEKVTDYHSMDRVHKSKIKKAIAEAKKKNQQAPVDKKDNAKTFVSSKDVKLQAAQAREGKKTVKRCLGDLARVYNAKGRKEEIATVKAAIAKDAKNRKTATQVKRDVRVAEHLIRTPQTHAHNVFRVKPQYANLKDLAEKRKGGFDLWQESYGVTEKDVKKGGIELLGPNERQLWGKTSLIQTNDDEDTEKKRERVPTQEELDARDQEIYLNKLAANLKPWRYAKFANQVGGATLPWALSKDQLPPAKVPPVFPKRKFVRAIIDNPDFPERFEADKRKAAYTRIKTHEKLSFDKAILAESVKVAKDAGKSHENFVYGPIGEVMIPKIVTPVITKDPNVPNFLHNFPKQWLKKSDE